jgi:signal transduction histidine kinase
MGTDQLDTLALMRSSLALAQEKDSLVLLCTLLRILCQFSRCDYAAIALSNEDDRSTFRLKAAGPFQRIVSYDVDIADDAAYSICPASIMLHVARTGVPIRKPVTTSRLRHDPFYNDRQPRTFLCLPIHHQGVPSGVIVLLSMNSASSAVQYESACEVVQTLATFAYIIHLHQVFTQSLKTEVAQRTRELTSALQTKTQFLSQCSHELRSPLAAIMGLASVLEANPALTAIQREHLQTISNSGHDLLALISNILDHSKLESNSVLLENISFSVRQVVESAMDTIAPVAQSKNVELTPLSMFKNEPPGLMGDPFRVKQVLLNLMSNAVKFTPPNDITGKNTSRVTVDRSWEEMDDGRIKVILTVEDTGVGIHSSKLHKLFKSFSQVDESITRSYGGSGLGLVISRDLSRLLGGDCSVESEYGKGSKFTFTFIADRDPKWKPTRLRRFETMRKAVILTAPEMRWGSVLEDDLRGFNIAALRFTDKVDLGLQSGYAGGLDAGESFDFILVDTSRVTRDQLATIRQLQPNATVSTLLP